ncbi:MAG: glycosyltransferase [Synergistota bacterium]|nr:glycosyltransferase [Synergistota bacterium]
MSDLLSQYAEVVGEQEIRHMRALAKRLHGARVVHVNSTKSGGGVAELLNRIVPLQKELGLDVEWEIIEGKSDFFVTTKNIHNALQGAPVTLSEPMWKIYEETNRANAEMLENKLKEAGFVFIHDPQPAALINHFPQRSAKWIWRCHIDVSTPQPSVWRRLERTVSKYDASIFSLAQFAQALPHPQYLITPSIDPLSEKNIDLPQEEIEAVFDRFNLDRKKPLLLQVSRFDRFKDPLGVIEAYKTVKSFQESVQLVLAGGGASDDPEGGMVLGEVLEAAKGDPDIHVLELPPTANRTINALQRAADVVLQKSLREGFGLTVTEALWKYKPVVGGDTGGIRLQVIDRFNGFRVRTPEGAALRIRYLLHHHEKAKRMGQNAHNFVKDNFLITQQVRNYLALMMSLKEGEVSRLEVVV